LKRSQIILLTAAQVSSVAVFAVVAALMTRGGTLRLDRELSEGIHLVATPVLDAVFAVLTQLGGALVLVPVILTVGGLAWVRGHRRAALVLAGIGLATLLVNVGLKTLFARPRPDLFPVELLGDYSFPSGHAMSGLAVWGTAALVAARLDPRLRRPAAAAALVLALGIATSRVYLGVHWPSDVLAGLAAGGFMLGAGVWALGPAATSSAR
jgi:undecaprenyl-diphosphatase